MTNHRIYSPPVIIYQMGKVGSSTILHSLETSDAPNPVFHVHFLSRRGIQDAIEHYKAFPEMDTPVHLHASLYLNDLFIKSRDRVRWKIITLVRDPVAREISDLFQNMGTLMPDLGQQSQEAAAEKICAFLHDRFMHFDENNDYACTWFDRELKTTFKFDIFTHSFQPENGVGMYCAASADILVLRLENLNQVAEKAIIAFLDLSHFRLVTRNSATKKSIYGLYEEVKRRFQLPTEILDRIYDSRFVRFFYSRLEIERFKKIWGRPLSVGAMGSRMPNYPKETI